MRFLEFTLILSLTIAAAVLIVFGKIWAWAIVAPAFLLLIAFLFKQFHSKASFIRFSSEGVTISYLYHELFFKWTEIEEIRVERKKNLNNHTFRTPLIRSVLLLRQMLHPTGLQTVVLSVSDAAGDGRAEFVLPYTYQMPPEKLAELLSQWKLQHDAEVATTA